MTLYLLQGNTCYYEYGYEARVFGIYTDKETAEKVKNTVVNDIYKKEKEDGWFDIEDVSVVEASISILEIEADKYIDVRLGGYSE